MPGTAAGWGRGGGRGRQERWEEGQRIELARPHGKNWICFHSSSNKQQGNFASAHLRLNTFRLRGIRHRQFSSRESAVMSKISSGEHSPQYLLLVFAPWHQRAPLTINLLTRQVWIRISEQVGAESKGSSEVGGSVKLGWNLPPSS